MAKDRGYIVVALLASLMLLPASVFASHDGFKGSCTNCHIMHASEDNVTTTPNNQLLRFVSCVGCHAYTTNSAITGRAPAGGIEAPQVHDSTTPLSGGYFDSASDDNNQHNVYDLSLPVSANLDGGNIPGSIVPYNAGSQISCESCHDSTIGHSAADLPRDGTSTSSYRMLGNGGGFYVKGTGNANFEAGVNGQNIYDAETLNLFCASCHGLFHAANQGVGKDPIPNAWFRHPTDVNLKTEIVGATFNGDKIIPMGTVGVNPPDVVMCISCHHPHGSAQPDLLRYDYGANIAGSGGAAVGCETCHGAK